MPTTLLTQAARSAGAPLIATGCFASILSLFVVVQMSVAFSSSSNSVLTQSEEFNVPTDTADTPVPPPAAPSCEQQTWPYIEQRCRGDAAGPKRLVRVISPERAPTPKGTKQAQRIPAIAEAEPASQGRGVAQVYAALSPQPTTGMVQQAFTPADPTPNLAVYPNKTAPLDAAAAPTPRRATRTPRLVARVAQRQPAVRRVGNQGRMAKAEPAVPSANFSPPDIAHGLY